MAIFASTVVVSLTIFVDAAFAGNPLLALPETQNKLKMRTLVAIEEIIFKFPRNRADASSDRSTGAVQARATCDKVGGPIANIVAVSKESATVCEDRAQLFADNKKRDDKINNVLMARLACVQYMPSEQKKEYFANKADNDFIIRGELDEEEMKNDPFYKDYFKEVDSKFTVMNALKEYRQAQKEVAQAAEDGSDPRAQLRKKKKQEELQKEAKNQAIQDPDADYKECKKLFANILGQMPFCSTKLTTCFDSVQEIGKVMGLVSAKAKQPVAPAKSNKFAN